ncbi:hypothetical protein ETB97_005232 [Aspergillus alliaceus]|uniref:Ubiquitin 3 binding protein But2 C-terminal domain-containing protein n=1 Tax=Petromyces alliaceus TaxID=209559 RepID=A0A8H6E3A4_PETAA|nr:hypothetical protein ETB97_005232 [Aspergillus burnettii]
MADPEATSLPDDDFIEPIHDRHYAAYTEPGTCHLDEILVPSDFCTIQGPSYIEILDAHNPHEHNSGQRFAVSRYGDDQRIKSVVTFQPIMYHDQTCTLVIEIPAIRENRYAEGTTTMEVWTVDRFDTPTWDNQPRKRHTVGMVTFPTFQVHQGWIQRFMPISCSKEMSFMVELSHPRSDGKVVFWNQLIGKQGAPPIGWRILQGGC